MAGQNWGTSTCNDKIVGARYYYAGFGRKNIDKSDYKSPRDGAGHGSHTSSTAAGNYGVAMSIDGHPIGTGSGMAPGAKIAMYKVCWTGEAPIPDGCFNSDSVAAINDAVADGVDVINYSIGGTSESDVFDSVEQAFRGASNAGRLRRQLCRQQRTRRQHARPSIAVAHHGRGGDIPAGLPGRRARQRRPLRRRIDDARHCRPHAAS